MREDAAWSYIYRQAAQKGATLDGDYGDSHRPVRPTAKVGSSRVSFHYCARAVDICQDFTLSKNHRYFVGNESVGATRYWRIYCKADRQDGSQGTLIRKGTLKHQQFKPVANLPLPEGYYIDLTALIESTGKFERIKAQSGWQASYNKAEW